MLISIILFCLWASAGSSEQERMTFSGWGCRNWRSIYRACGMVPVPESALNIWQIISPSFLLFLLILSQLPLPVPSLLSYFDFEGSKGLVLSLIFISSRIMTFNLLHLYTNTQIRSSSPDLSPEPCLCWYHCLLAIATGFLGTPQTDSMQTSATHSLPRQLMATPYSPWFSAKLLNSSSLMTGLWPPKRCWSPNPRYLQLWLYLSVGFLQMMTVKWDLSEPYSNMTGILMKKGKFRHRETCTYCRRCEDTGTQNATEKPRNAWGY